MLGDAAKSAVRSSGTRARHGSGTVAAAYPVRIPRHGAGMSDVSGGDTPPSADAFVEEQVPSGQRGANAGPAVLSMDQVAADANAALQNVIAASGSIRSGMVLRAMQQANVQLEKEMAILQEESGEVVTLDMLRERRIVIQTEAVSRVILQQMEQGLGYGQGSEAYAKAESYVRDKVRGLFESRDKPLV